ncbi:hypothetical protein SAMN02745671_00104 [Anaerovibrio lipolyticus DSM 3074]|uniref:Autotransporter domain-containing protein n=2 Tax=Anaerovibrio lipolyticus TaxID=82374 RepID=A0A0B2K115_9FIRM|nr:autotransporter outer membrane beta-barrel domain-containing protein [Anaerovibrio lipolyticus]KHM52516.1 hypothetical protein NZ47_04335 [Anaerovibrio lipolyticus]SHI29471.1 hypothetical protein SAMN02745671_00104 [Anaerovibrio lipolyticus DSM 3074]
MTKKEKEQNMKLARYIACALMLGNGLLFAPVAEATAYEVNDATASGMQKDETNSVLYGNAGGSSTDTLTINFDGTDFNSWFISCGFVNNNTTGNTLQNNTTTVTKSNPYGIYSAYQLSGTCGDVKNNKLIFNGGLLPWKMGAAYLSNDNSATVENNILTIKSFTGKLGTVDLYGGYGGKTNKDNAININAAVTVKNIYVGQVGSGTGVTSTGNTLNLGVKGITTETVGYTQKITIGYKDTKTGTGTHLIDFANGGTVLSATGLIDTSSSSFGLQTLDITANKDKFLAATSGTMHLLSGGGATDFSNLKLDWWGGTGQTIGTSGITITEDENAQTSTDNNVTLTYKGAHKVLLTSDKKGVDYSVVTNAKDVSFGDITWNTSAAARSGTGYTFDGDTTISASNLSFTGSGLVNALSDTNKTMTLLSNASGITGNHITPTQPSSTSASFTHNGIAYEGSVNGTLDVSGTDVNYTLSSGTLNTINLNGWNGIGDVSLSGWTAKDGGVSVETGSFTATPVSGTIITATDGFFGDITGDKAYSASGTFSGDTDKGVTLSGTKSGGVKTNDAKSALIYEAEQRQAKTISLGDMTWDDGRTAATNYDFSGVESIDASKLKFSFTGDKANTIKATDTTEILKSATNLAADLPATYASGTSHSQGISYTDSNSVTLSGTLTGNVSTVANEVDYTVTSKTLENISLNGWNGTGGLAIDASWTPGTGGGIDVDTGTFATPTTGGNVDIFTLPTLGGFVFGDVTGDKVYKEGTAFSGDTKKGVTFSGTESGGIKKSDDNKKLTYFAETKNTQKIVFGNMTWNDGRTAESNNNFSNVSEINVSNLNFTFNGTDANTIKKTDTMALLKSATGLEADKTVTGTPKSQNISATDATGIKLSGTLTGAVSTSAGQVDYTVTEKTLNKVDLSSWNGITTSVDTSWEAPEGGVIAVDTGTFTPPTTVNPGTTVDIFTAPTGTTFGNVAGTGSYKENEPFKGPSKGGVTLEGSTSGGVKTEEGATKLTYTGIQNSVNKITLGKITNPAAEFGNEYNFAGVTTVDDSGLSFENPENIGNGDNVTLFTSANSSLTPSGSPTDKTVSYSTTPVTGVTLNGQITGSYSNTNSAMTYSATANNAQKLTFGNVEWKDTGALIDHSTTLTKVNFDGASVDTSNINFTNIQELEANKQMTLVSNFGGTPGTITGSKYKVGSTLQGEGKASMDGDNLIFTADTTAEKMQVQEQTHNTLMGASASMTSLAQGNEFINRTMDDMFLSANVGRDGIASFAHIGGGSLRQETGSHVNTRTWNAIVALGHQNKKPRNTFEYGAFVEYGTGNYTTYNGDERGDGSSRYVGGGLMAKWTAPSGLYVEGSLRGGSINDDGHNLLRDVNGVPYSYNVDTPYYGFHLGVGKKIPMKGGNTLDLFAKYFYNHRNSTSFDAGGHYELDAITSQIIRVGARYTVKRDKWNYYGGLAYEHELDGKGGGWADGMAIRGVDTSGGSFRAELGATVIPNEDIPLTLDFNLVGFAGKKQGIFGGMGLKFNF